MARPTKRAQALRRYVHLWLSPAVIEYLEERRQRRGLERADLVRELIDQQLPDHILKGDRPS